MAMKHLHILKKKKLAKQAQHGYSIAIFISLWSFVLGGPHRVPARPGSEYMEAHGQRKIFNANISEKAPFIKSSLTVARAVLCWQTSVALNK